MADGARSAGAEHSGQQGEDGEAGRLLDGGAIALQGKRKGEERRRSSSRTQSVTVWLCRQAVDEHLKETQAQYQTLERKYSKAKRLVKEYQQK